MRDTRGVLWADVGDAGAGLYEGARSELETREVSPEKREASPLKAGRQQSIGLRRGESERRSREIP